MMQNVINENSTNCKTVYSWTERVQRMSMCLCCYILSLTLYSLYNFVNWRPVLVLTTIHSSEVLESILYYTPVLFFFIIFLNVIFLTPTE